jgi:ubiquinone biosynthesis protein Coq4
MIRDYTHIDTNLTLREGIEQYYSMNPEFGNGQSFLGMDAQAIKEHDAVHVVFGLSTSSREELLVEVITALGCKVGTKNVLDSFKKSFFIEVLKLFGPYRLIKRFLFTFPDVIKTSIMCLRLHKRWPHNKYEGYLDHPLVEIRKQFNIKLVW